MQTTKSTSYLKTGNLLRVGSSLLSKHIDDHFPCYKCSLYKTSFKYVIFRGVLPAQVLFVGEAPGHRENELGIPFIGRSGDILDHLIKDSFLRTGHYTYGVTNVICCLPVNSDDIDHFRLPASHEIKACRPRLLDIVRKCDPQLVVLLGKVAEKGFPIQDVETHCISIQHPAYILRKGGVGDEDYPRVDYTRNLLDLVEGLRKYVKKTKKQLKKKVKAGGDEEQTKRSNGTRKKKKNKKRTGEK